MRYRLALSCWLLLAPLAASADEADHDRARDALAAGEILPLGTVLSRIERSHPGQVLEVELERKGARWIYEIKIIRPGGGVAKLKLDALDASLLAQRERH